MGLANYDNILDRVGSDVVQIGWAVTSAYGDKYALSNVSGLPFVVDDLVAANVAQWRLYKTGLLDSEFRDMVPLWFGQGANLHLFFAKPPKSLTDLNGLKARIFGNRESELVKTLGITPLSLPAQEMYQALQSGIINLTITTWEAVPAFKLQEVITYEADTNVKGGAMIIFMARSKYDSLPPAVRTAIEARSGEKASRDWAIAVERSVQENVAALGTKMTHAKFPPQVQADLKRNYADPYIDAWVKMHAGGQQVLDTYKKIYADVIAGK
jgi:TRAP-type transport system periplasmic protein